MYPNLPLVCTEFTTGFSKVLSWPALEQHHVGLAQRRLRLHRLELDLERERWAQLEQKLLRRSCALQRERVKPNGDHGAPHALRSRERLRVARDRVCRLAGRVLSRSEQHARLVQGRASERCRQRQIHQVHRAERLRAHVRFERSLIIFFITERTLETASQ